jgi:hypothetical protein
MKSNTGYVVLSVLGVAICILFLLMSQSTPELNAQESTANKTSNKIIMHIHANLSVTVNGKSLIVPNGIGINSSLWKDHSLDKFGTEQKANIFGLITPAMSPLHTHDSSGTIRVESTEYRNYTLGQFLNIWGIPLQGSKINLLTDGNSTENYDNYILKDGDKMILKIED